MRHEEYGRCVYRSGKDASENLFSSPFFSKIKLSHTQCRDCKYNAGQEIRPGYPEYYDVHEQKYLSSQHANTELIRVVIGEGEFHNANDLLVLRE